MLQEVRRAASDALRDRKRQGDTNGKREDLRDTTEGHLCSLERAQTDNRVQSPKPQGPRPMKIHLAARSAQMGY